MSSQKIHDTPIPGLKVIERNRLSDERGFLSRVFCRDELAAAGWNIPVLQINHTHTREKGTLRGLHFQYPPHAEMKLVSCLEGEVWDVAVDMRRNSPTFLQWHAEKLGRDNLKSLLIPAGCAHGFQALTDNVDMLYLHSARYHPESEAGLNPLDARLAIDWPLPPSLMSDRDRGFAMITSEFEGVDI